MIDYANFTKEAAIEILIGRIKTKFPGADPLKERAVLERQSRAKLLHSVGAQLYGDLDQVNHDLCAYAESQMTPEEQRAKYQAR